MREGEGHETKHIAKTTYGTTKNSLTKRTIARSKVRNLPQDITIKRTRRIGPRNRRTKKDQKGGSIPGELAKWGGQN